jgi:hypothetical protein
MALNFRRAGRPKTRRRALPPPGVIRRERRLVERTREQKLRDLGGLMLEMYRRDTFREDLLTERCNELLGLDARLHELDEMLAAARRRIPAGRCECGAPLPWNSHFCPNCGRPAGEQASSPAPCAASAGRRCALARTAEPSPEKSPRRHPIRKPSARPSRPERRPTAPTMAQPDACPTQARRPSQTRSTASPAAPGSSPRGA